MHKKRLCWLNPAIGLKWRGGVYWRALVIISINSVEAVVVIR